MIYDWIYGNHINTLDQITHIHFDFTIPGALRSLRAMKEKEIKRGVQDKEDKRVEENPKTDIPFNFYFVYVGGKKML